MNERKIKIFKTFQEQEMYFLEYFFDLTPSARLQALTRLQKQNLKDEFMKRPQKKITLYKQFMYGR